MNIKISVSSSVVTPQDLAEVTLSCEELGLASKLDIEFLRLYRRCRIPSETVLDFLFFSSIVYSIDKLISRDHADDKWTRDLAIEIPIIDQDLWNSISEDLGIGISYLTGDKWSFKFVERTPQLHRRRKQRRIKRVRGNTVCLFSGGLDSLIGAINWLETNSDSKLVLVGHHDYPGAQSDQNSLWGDLYNHYGRRRLDLLQVRVGQKPSGDEISLRSRSLVFLALGVYVASSIASDTPVLIPENGNIALNVPLTPSRRGACSTRTTHPFFFHKLEEALRLLGIENGIFNPLEEMTKGECVDTCLNQELLEVLATKSVSCAKRGHSVNWIDKSASACGYCMPCIFRRAALNVKNLDIERYGRDICTGEVDPRSERELPNDFRAVLSFLRRSPSQSEISELLVTNSKIDLHRLSDYSAMIDRAMDEVRNLIQEKGSDDIKHFAGIG